MAIDFVLAALLVFVFVFFLIKYKRLIDLYKSSFNFINSSSIPQNSNLNTLTPTSDESKSDQISKLDNKYFIRTDEIQTSVDRLKKKVQEIDSASRSRDQQIGSSQSKLQSDMHNTVDALDRTRTSLLYKIEDLKKEIKGFQKDIAQFKAEIKQQSISAQNAFDAHSNITDKLQKNYSDISRRLISLTTQVDTVYSALNDLSKENEALKATNDDLQSRLEFFTGIKEESTHLNLKEDFAARETLLDKIAVLPFSASENNQKSEGVSNSESLDSLLDAEQYSALYLVTNSRKNAFITGKAGCGKSFLIDAICRRIIGNVLKLAPTGISALNIGGATIHSAFGYNNLEMCDVDDITPTNHHLKDEQILALQNADTIIIDEISMVRADIFDKIDKILRIIMRSDEPFGEKQMVLVGDLFQLPPIAKSKEQQYLLEKYGGIFFFHADAYQNGDFEFIELTINHRQEKDARFFDILNRIREGAVRKEDIDTINEHVKEPRKNSRVPTLYARKVDVIRVNQEELSKIDSAQDFTYVAETVVKKQGDITSLIESTFPIYQELHLKQGAFVMMVANDLQSHRWVNGTLGIVDHLEKDKVFVSIDGVVHQIDRFEFTEKEARYENGRLQYETVFSVYQYPIVLAYALTIHKAQGSTYPAIACNLKGCFTPGQAYVALSRCVRMDELYLKHPLKISDIKVDDDALQFYQAHSKHIYFSDIQ